MTHSYSVSVREILLSPTLAFVGRLLSPVSLSYSFVNFLRVQSPCSGQYKTPDTHLGEPKTYPSVSLRTTVKLLSGVPPTLVNHQFETSV